MVSSYQRLSTCCRITCCPVQAVARQLLAAAPLAACSQPLCSRGVGPPLQPLGGGGGGQAHLQAAANRAPQTMTYIYKTFI